MDPIFPLAIVAGIAMAAALGWRTVRHASRRGGLRTSWRIVGYWCRQHYDDCRVDAQGRCAVSKKLVRPGSGLLPLTKYQYQGRGTGLWIDKDGPLVGSLCVGQWKPSDDTSDFPHGTWHAPLFDFDFEAELRADGRTLRIKKPVAQDAYLKLLETMEGFGLIKTGFAAFTRSALDREAPTGGIEGYRASDGRVLPESILPLAVPAKLVPSSTEGHFHLYLELEMRWDDYLRVMRDMAHAGLLERSWVEMSERRKVAILRKPDVRKGEEEYPLGSS